MRRPWSRRLLPEPATGGRQGRRFGPGFAGVGLLSYAVGEASETLDGLGLQGWNLDLDQLERR